MFMIMVVKERVREPQGNKHNSQWQVYYLLVFYIFIGLFVHFIFSCSIGNKEITIHRSLLPWR